MPVSRAHFRCVIAVFGVLLLGCADPTATARKGAPDAVQARTVSDPTVTSAVPAEAPADTTLDVAINGTGFSSGAKASMQLNGAVDQHVRVNSTRFVSSTQVTANVTIAVDAVQTSYDVVVTLTSGKKGIGTEMFAVKAPTGNAVASVEVIPATASLDAGTKFQLAARTRTKTGNVVTGRVVTWTSSNDASATVDANGLVTGVSSGSATITATSEGVSGTAAVTVRSPAIIAPVASVTSGSKTSCSINASGSAFCWGDGGVGQLGNGVLAASSAPVGVSGGLTFSAISPAIYHGCGLIADGSAYCWGRNDQGALGDGSLTQHISPAPITGGLHFTVIKTGMHFSCGLVASGAAYCWGQGQFGVLGNGTTVVSSTPVLVSGAHVFTELATGLWQACAVDTSGAAWCWGDNRGFGLGDGTATNATTPVRVIGGITFSRMTAGENFTCGLTRSGAAYCWGYDYFGALGDGKSGTGTSRGNPMPVLGGLTFTSLRAGNTHVCGLTGSGTAYCWGDNSHGAFGDGSFVSKSSPVPGAIGLTFSALSAGTSVTCGVSTDNVAYCWGAGALGQLGNGSTSDSNVPIRVNGQP